MLGRAQAAGSPPPENQSVRNERFIIQTERALVVASNFLVERNITDAVKTVVRYLLRWVILESADGIVRTSPVSAGLMCQIPCGLVSPGDPDYAFRLGAEMSSAIGPESYDRALGGIVAAIISRTAHGDDLRDSVVAELDVHSGRLQESLTTRLQRVVEWTALGRPPAASALRPLGSPGEDILVNAIGSALRHPASFRAGVSMALRCREGSTAVATLTGALLGASLGENGIPRECLEHLESRDEAVSVTDSLHRTFGSEG